MTEDRAVAIFGSSRTDPGSSAWGEAEAAGARLAGAGLIVVTGGYGGSMEAASKGAAAAGGRVVGVTAPELFPDRAGANHHISHEITASSLHERIGILTQVAHGALVLPGSIGTATELLITWNINHIARIHGGTRFPTVAVGTGWNRLSSLLTEDLEADGTDVHIVATAEAGVDWLLDQPELAIT